MSSTPDSSLRVHFLGTGTSTALPVGPCLAQADKPSRDVGLFLDDYNAAPEEDKTPARWGGFNPHGAWPESVACGSCRGAVDPRVAEGWKNRRGNPAVVLRKQTNGVWKNVVVDVGKTFREQSCRLFPQWGIKRIDAVILTHGHADAYNGLDDLREWCGRQGGSIPIYLSKTTFETVEQSFPYLVDKTKASGGGDLPSLKFVIIEEECEFEVEGIHVRTLPVYHGSYFHSSPAPAPGAPGAPSAPTTTPSTPVAAAPAPAPGPYGAKPVASKEPFICLGFVFERKVVYLSDVSSVPDRTWSLIDTSLDNPELSLLVVDALWPWRMHPSHVGFPQAMEIALRVKAQRTLILGMTHPTTHYMWEEVGLSIRGQERNDEKHSDHLLSVALLEKIWATPEMGAIKDELHVWGGEVGPAWDGLGVDVGPNGVTELPLGRGSAGGWGLEVLPAAL